MRPLADGRGNFWHIVKNLRHAIDYLNVSIRVNVDRHNFSVAGDLLQILADEGFTGKLKVALGRLSGGENGGAPSKAYAKCSLTIPEYAQIEREFVDLAIRYGFAGVELPQPTAAPCTAVRSNELIVGSEGELYKCYQSARTVLHFCAKIPTGAR
jgi:uncharacterized protein